jgi:hypothetical protein
MVQLSLQQCEIPHPFVEISYPQQFTVIECIFYFRTLVADHMPPLSIVRGLLARGCMTGVPLT